MKDASHSGRGSESTHRFILQKICEEMELDPGRVKPLESRRGDFRWEDNLGKSETVRLGHACPRDESAEPVAEASQESPNESEADGEPAAVAAADDEDDVPLPEPSCRAGPAPASDDPAYGDPETVNSKRAKAKKQLARAFRSADRSAAPSPADAKSTSLSANAPSAGRSVVSSAGKTATSPGASSRSSDTLISRKGRLDQTILSPDGSDSTAESSADIEITEEKRRDFAWRSEYLLNVIREVESMDADEDDAMSATAIRRRRVRSTIKLTLFALSLAASGTLAVLALGLYLL